MASCTPHCRNCRGLYTSLTGGGRVGPVLAFAERLAKLDLNMTVRFLLIPGVTDSEQNIAELALFVLLLPRRPQVEVRGFQRLGLDAYRRQGERYPLQGVPEATAGQVARASRLFTEHGCPATP